MIPQCGLALNGLQISSVACSPSRSGATMLSITWGRWNAAQLHLWLHFLTPPYPMMTGRWHAISATLLSQWLVWGLDGCACGEPVPSLFSQDKLNFTSSVLIKRALCFQNCYLATWVTPSQLKIMRKTIGQVRCPSPHSPQSTMT